MVSFVPFSFVPLRNPVGFGAIDCVELAVALLLVTLALLWRPWIAPFSARLARGTALCMLLLAVLPVALRLLLLANHPVPVPDIYDEFGHLLIADTLRHGRLANPPHPLPQFFETFFVLQHPTYSSIYPLGNGLTLAIGQAVFGTPWAGVLLSTAAFCSLTYWMLRGWVSPGWALLGGVLTVMEFGPLNQWTNNYWGGAFSAAAGCLVYGALPRLRNRARWRDGALLGLGIAMHVLSRPYETVFLVATAGLYFLPEIRQRSLPLRPLLIAALVVLPALGLTALQNKRVTGESTTLPYRLSQYQYGVPAPLTLQSSLTPHAPLTREQDLDFRMQRGFHPGKDSLTSYWARLIFRTRYYRFYFYAPLYLALAAFLASLRTYRWAWVAIACAVFALGVNFFPAFQFHYVAAVVCLFVLMSVKGLERITRFPHGVEAARAIVFLCIAQFVFWYSLHVPDTRDFATRTRAFDTWDSINHGNPERRIAVAQMIARELKRAPGKLLVFVQYWPQHPFQEEWVYNSAAIDEQCVVWARDLGGMENQKLIAYYRDRTVLLLEPDARPPRLSDYSAVEAAPVQMEQVTAPAPTPVRADPPNAKKPILELEQVR